MARQQDNQSGTTQRNQNSGTQETEKDRQNRPSNENSPSSEERRYTGGAPDSTRQFGEAKGSIKQPGITNPTDDEDLNPTGQPIGDAGDEVPFPSGTRQPSPSRTPARGPGTPPSSGLGDEEIESPTTPMNDKTGRIETGKRNPAGKTPDSGRKDTF